MSFAEDKASVQALVNTLTGQANGFLTALVTAANIPLISGTTELPEFYNYASVPQISFPLSSVGGNVTFPSNAPPVADPTIALTAFSQIAVPEFLGDSLLAPTTQFNYDEEVYLSILMDPLKTKLLDNLTNGGYGIETNDDKDLFNRARDREVEAMQSRISDAGRFIASRGFPLPPGELSIHVDRAYQDMQDKISSASRDITLERSKLFVENRQFTIVQVRELEVVTIGLHNAIRERALNVSKATVEFAIALYNTQLARFKMSLDRAKTAADAQVENLRIQFEQARTQLELFRAKIVGYEANLKRQIETTNAQIALFRANIEDTRLIHDGRVAATNLQQKVLEATIQQNIQIDNLTIENARVRLLGVIEQLRFKTGAAQYGAEKFFAQLTALESTVNVLTVQTATGT